MSFDPVHLSFELTRRQQLAAHLGIWLRYWPGVLMLCAIVAGVVTLAVRKSPWFLVILLLGIPPLHNLHRLVAGFVVPLLCRPMRMDVVIEEDRIGFGCRGGQEWLPLAEIKHVERFADVWSIGCGDALINIPVGAVEERTIDHVRAASAKHKVAGSQA